MLHEFHTRFQYETLPMFAKPQSEHTWLQQFVGEWDVRSQCRMSPDELPQQSGGRMSCRSLGGLWLIAEGEGESPDGEASQSIMTIGYDPQQQRYIGTFVASMMTHLWPYSGVRDANGNRLMLDSEGPRFDGAGRAKYRDTIEVIDRDHWKFSGEVLMDDGSWQNIMSSDHRRR